MANWTQNIITLGQNVSQERFEEVLLNIMSMGQEKESAMFSSIASLKKALNKKHAHFNFNILIPAPDHASREWCEENWGTTKNAQNTDIDWRTREICFQTTWSEPSCIIYAFAAKFPDINFIWAYVHDDPYLGTGFIAAQNGRISGNEPELLSSNALELYVQCWGESDDIIRDESGEWHWVG